MSHSHLHISLTFLYASSIQYYCYQEIFKQLYLQILKERGSTTNISHGNKGHALKLDNCRLIYINLLSVNVALSFSVTAPSFWPPSATVVSAEPFSHGTGTLRCLQKEMATYRHWSVSLWRDPDDGLTLSNPIPWQNWMAAYLGYTLRMRTLFRGWPIMVNDTHTRRRRLDLCWGMMHV